MPRPSHSYGFYNPRNIGWSVQIIKLLIINSHASFNYKWSAAERNEAEDDQRSLIR
jgi:hypothetical protein